MHTSPAEAGTLHQLLFNERRLRSGWRIAIFFLLFIVFFAVGQVLLALLPAAMVTWVALSLLVASALLAGWIVLARLDGRPIGALGFALVPAAAREVGAGLLIGAVLIAGASLLVFASGAAHFVPDDGTVSDYVRLLVWTFAFFSLAAAWEELVFRGYPFQALVEGVGVWPATLVSSAAFSWLHAQNPNITALAFVNIFLAGVLLSVAYLRTRSLWFATALHVGWNWTMGSLIDVPVSGLEEGLNTPLYSAVLGGPEWWTGGAFGPEAGLAGTVVLVAGTLWMLRTPRLRPAPEMAELGPIVDRRPQVAEP
ncbi:MAG TPA: type II CAAX endopeptidase family protein [Longimicrobiaceae bacterium]|nr:type II CAAX endopeptidase family protein [Longimicrobiaceae bacterium]